MCPDEQILSSYIDEELPSPWKERLEQHIAHCQVCAGKVADMARLRSLLLADQDWDTSRLSAAKERIARSLDFQGKTMVGSPALRKAVPGFMDRHVSLPLPYLAAGAALLLVALSIAAGSLAFSASATARVSASRSYSARDIPIEAILQYASRSANQPMMIDLPPGSTFNLYGEPVVTAVTALEDKPGGPATVSAAAPSSEAESSLGAASGAGSNTIPAAEPAAEIAPRAR